MKQREGRDSEEDRLTREILHRQTDRLKRQRKFREDRK